MCAGLVVVGLLSAAARPAAAQDEPTYTLDTLWVEIGSRASAALPVATRAVQVISAEEIRQTPARTVADLLVGALGVDPQPRSAAQADVGVRGASFEQVLVLVDGAPVSDAQTGHFDMDIAVPLTEVERVEILRGAASALYGADAMGGVINVVTRDGTGGASVEGRVYGGSFGTSGASATAAASGRDFGARVSAEYRRSDGHREGTDYRIAQARATGHARLGQRVLRAHVGAAARDFGARYFYTPVGSPWDEYEKTRTATASLAVQDSSDGAFSIEPRLSLRRHEDDFVLDRADPSFYRNVHTSWQAGGELVARYTASDAVRIVAGGEAYGDRLRSNSLGDRDEERGAVFAELAAGRLGHAAVNAGIRADWHSSYETFLAPSLSGAIWPADRLRIRASVGRAFRAPSWTDRYYEDPANVGDPDLAPERSTDAELGLDLIAMPGFYVSLTGFLREAEALIDWARPVDAAEDAPWRAMNIEDALFQGFEFEATATALLGARWRVHASGMSFETENADGYDSRYVLRPLTRTIGLDVSRPLPGGLRASARVLRARRPGEPSYLRGDLRLAWEWSDGRVYADVTNVGDERYMDVASVPAPGRAVYVGMAWRPIR